MGQHSAHIAPLGCILVFGELPYKHKLPRLHASHPVYITPLKVILVDGEHLLKRKVLR